MNGDANNPTGYGPSGALQGRFQRLSFDGDERKYDRIGKNVKTQVKECDFTICSYRRR